MSDILWFNLSVFRIHNLYLSRFCVLQFILWTVESQSEPTTKRQVGKLLDMMSRRSAKAFDAFLFALVMTDQEHVAEVLDRNRTADLVRRRDAERGVHTVAQASSSGYTSPSAMVPSGSPVTPVPSSHSNAVPSSSGQKQFTPSGMYFCTFMPVQSML